MPGDFALGFRVKSGFAVAVVVSGTTAAPVALMRRIVQLSDPGIKETKQPYHDGFGTAQEDTKEIARLSRIIQRCAKRSVADLLSDESLAGRRCRGAGLVVGSVIEPARVGNPHIRAHASEGRLFRMVLESALSERGVVCSVIVEKTLASEAARTLDRPGGKIAKVVGLLGAARASPWRAEEKAAATAAWMLLSKS